MKSNPMRSPSSRSWSSTTALRCAVGVAQQLLHRVFQRGVFARTLEEWAVLQIAFGVNPSDRRLALAQGTVQAVAHRRLHQPLDHPEAACQQRHKRHKTKEERARPESCCHPVLPVAAACAAEMSRTPQATEEKRLWKYCLSGSRLLWKPALEADLVMLSPAKRQIAEISTSMPPELPGSVRPSAPPIPG